MTHPMYRVQAFEVVAPYTLRVAFDPATLHDWPQCAAAFEEMASHWESARV